MLGGTAGDGVRQRTPSSPSSVHTHSCSTSLTPPEAQCYSHMAPRVVLLLKVLQRKVTGTSDKLPGKSISTTVDLGTLVKQH